ncbi:MAG TPA: PilN domain-containing protein [Usitatibacteraceae bacterium]|nr:PilN domain-containing protein [Usitatibacteraceae bacterium]
MKRLRLDLAGPRGSSAGWILLGLALVALADLGASWRQLDEEIAAAEQQAARPRARVGEHTARGARGGEGAAGDLRDADRIARSLSLPWEALFRSVEEATDEQVALLALQPDPQKHELSISGEAKDYAAILAFVARLDKRQALRNVHLVRHELREDDPQQPMYFNIVANWESGS